MSAPRKRRLTELSVRKAKRQCGVAIDIAHFDQRVMA